RTGRGSDGVELVARAEEEDGPTVDRRAAIEPQLVVPVRQGRLVRREAEDEPGVPVAGRGSDGRVKRRDGLSDEGPRLEHVEVDVDHVLVAARTNRPPVDDAAHVPAV